MGDKVSLEKSEILIVEFISAGESTKCEGFIDIDCTFLV
jgi:hypothetical protein